MDFQQEITPSISTEPIDSLPIEIERYRYGVISAVQDEHKGKGAGGIGIQAKNHDGEGVGSSSADVEGDEEEDDGIYAGLSKHAKAFLMRLGYDMMKLLY